jgi:hypothetical protein
VKIRQTHKKKIDMFSLIYGNYKILSHKREEWNSVHYKLRETEKEFLSREEELVLGLHSLVA